ncbi:hypothetical protein GCM10011415_34990 [Salipiger pallidus]|uniref:DUF721 domain-containing protein n=1 Tax=Salipiger pallidus TaxID=1775170 RepID=A0A8J3EHS4_9RHOB|nr:DciA family protein [Salipiger pallidus]GGG82307.1 hypothetical protein GCM10011415_34990 [Salipiger pallidus]
MRKRGSSTYGFAQASGLMKGDIRRASESRGFAQSRLLTHWEEIAGPDIAAISRPVEVRYGRGGLGATLTLLTTGANAPVLEMQKAALKDKVNAIYGYAAISAIRVTQTAATGFADGKVAFEHRQKRHAPAEPAPKFRAEAHTATEGVADDGLRAALERLGANVISKSQR